MDPAVGGVGQGDCHLPGLPRRMPNAHLVPGAYSGGKAASPQRSAEEIRRRVADYQEGVRRARPPAGD